MFTIRIGGIEVTCGSVADTAALIAALGERGAARLLPDAVAERAADTSSGPPSPPATRAPRASVAPVAPSKKTGGQSPWSRGRKPTWTEDELKSLHARLRAGERLDELAAEKDAPPHRLYQSFKRAGLSVKFARPSAVPEPSVPVRRLAPGESGVEDEKGSYRRAG